MNIKNIKVAKKNPRTMGKESRKALAKSLETFGNISGITVNERTGNVVSGNHRWEELNKVHGAAHLKLVHLKGEFHALEAQGDFTGFIVRVVDWDEEMELAANVTANSNMVTGEFTSDLQVVLSEISEVLNEELFEDLRLDELQVDFDDIDDFDFEDGNEEVAARKRNEELAEPKDEKAPSEVKEITTTIKIVVPGELKDKVRKDISGFLQETEYFEEIDII